MANATLSFPEPPNISHAPGTGPGPLGVPGGTDRSYSVDIMVCAVLTSVIGLVFVGLRFYARFVIVRVLNWEDWVILVAQIFSVVMCGLFFHMAVLGHGQHCWDVPIANFVPMAKSGWVSILFYELSLWCSQVSILLLYIRIWTYPWVQYTAKWLLAIVMVYNVLVTVAVCTACVPLSAFWDFTLQLSGKAYCHPKSIWWANTAMHVITDFLIYLLPMPVIFTVRFPKRQKALLFVLFAFGFFVCAISVIRTWLLKITAVSVDFTYDNVSIAFWSCVETNGTVSIACFMTMKPLLSRLFPNLIEAVPERQNPAVAGSHGGRLPTIGSRPMRQLPVSVHRSVTASMRGYEALAADEQHVKNA